MVTPIFELSDNFVSELVKRDPIAATELGQTSELLPDFSPAYFESLTTFIEDTLSQLDSLEPQNSADVVAKLVLHERLHANLSSLRAKDYESDLNILACPIQSIRMVFDLMPLESDADKHVWVNRVKAIPGSVDSWISSLKAGIATGNVASKRQATEVAKQCQEYADATYFSPTAAGISDEAVQAALDAEISFVTAADFLVNVYEPVANAADGIGLEKYIRASRKWNGCDIDPHELFMWGWHELDRITERMQHITSQIDPTAKIADIRDILNTDPRYVIHGEENIVRFLEELTKKTTQVMAEKHFDIPDSIRICEVKLAGPGSAAAPYYMPPSEDLSRPGSTWLPTLGSAEFHSWGLVSTWYHEAVPGHHLQVGSTVINKDQLSRYQRTFGWTSGYGEGWALYAERLMDELGYFEDPGYEMGFLCAQALRAARIVVDIGMHFGWSVPEGQKWEPVGQLIDFDFSVEFLQRRALETPEFAISETIRYLGLPAQAISYKLGERTILQVRQDAMARHGDAFDLKAWHKALLDLGPVGLDTLVEQMASF